MKQTRITRVNLRNFRVHKHLELATDAQVVVLTGNNGVGKTSVLESISMMAPGKGLLNAANHEFIHSGECMDNNVAHDCDMEIDTNADFSFRLQTEQKAGKLVRKVSINNKPINRQVDLLQWVNILWLSSNMLHSLSLSVSDRRKFFDRAVFYIAPDHAQQINLYEKLLRERLKVLTMHHADKRWLSALELQIADACLAVMKNRLSFLGKFRENTGMSDEPLMPAADIEIVGEIERLLENIQDVQEAKLLIANRLQSNQKIDGASGRTNFGVHKSDFVVKEKTRQIALAQLSSGERKMLLMSIIYSIAAILSNLLTRRPIILVDEVISFLDEKNSIKLIGSFQEVGSQIWVASAVNIGDLSSDMQVITLP